MEVFFGVAAFVLLIVAAAFLWQFARNAYFWSAAKVLGWDTQEKFRRETAYLDRENARDERQYQHDLQADSGDRRRTGAAFVTTTAFVLVAANTSMPWWIIACTGVGTWLGLHMIAGVTIKWRWY
jgi:hypothetical protein